MNTPEFAVVVPLPTRDPDSHAPYSVVAALLSGRATRTWREHLPTLSAVSASCGYNGRFPAGPGTDLLVVRARSSSVDAARQMPELLRGELLGLAEQGPRPEELRRCVAALTLRHFRERDDVRAAAEALARAEALWRAADSHLARPGNLAAVTGDRVREAARDLMERPHGTVLLHGGEAA